jgi:heterodisulfide reductase subunit D
MSKESLDNTAEGNSPNKQDVREVPLDSLNMKQLIELDACTRCGECLTWCPVYDQDAKEDIIPRRKVIDFLKIAKAQHGLLAKIMKSEKLSTPLKDMLGRILGYRQIGRKEIDDFVQNLYECSTCGQCEVVCPAHIETVTLWEELRRIIVQAGYGPLEVQQALVKSVKAFDNPWQQPRAARTKWARKAKKEGLIASLPREIKKTKGKVLLFLGCTAAYDVNVKQVAINNINILEALEIDFGILGSEEKCCASVLLRMGDPEHKRVFKENIDLFNSLGIETLISSCSGCFKTIMQDYPKIAPLNFEVLHSVEFIARMLAQGRLTFPHPVNRTVTYHDPCHLGRATGGFDAPRMIMEAIPGLKLVEMPRNREYSRCCGAGGGLKAGFPDIQTKMAQRRIQEAEETGADQLVSCCPFCYQGLNVGITALESQLVMRDISALIAESLLGYDVFERAAQKAASQDDDKKARRAARKEARAHKKAARQVPKSERRPEPEKAETEAGTIAISPPETRPAVEEDPQALKKAERERKRAEKRAVRDKEKALRRKDRKTAPDQAPAATKEPVETAPQDVVTNTADLAPVENKSVSETATSDSKTERERKRAEKRAAREKEKAARRAAREKANGEDR